MWSRAASRGAAPGGNLERFGSRSRIYVTGRDWQGLAGTARRADILAADCPVRRVLSLIGDNWTVGRSSYPIMTFVTPKISI
jgi:hypothetical protein